MTVLVKDVLDRKNNNLNFVRLWLAFAVIIWHVPVFISAPEQKSIIKSVFNFADSGNVAVNSFFFFSGLLVTNSLFEKQDIKNYIISRFLRIYPAFFACLFISSIICFHFTDVDLSIYYKSALRFIGHNLFVSFSPVIDGVSFWRSGYPLNGQQSQVVNGAIWVILYEVKLYIFVLAIFLLAKIFQLYGKHIATIAFLIGIVSPFINLNLVLENNANTEPTYIVACFSFGGLLALHKNNIYFDWRMPIMFFLLGYVINNYIGHLFFFLALGCSCLYISTLKPIREIPISIDISYSVYLWGWFVQQLVQYYCYSFVNYYSYTLICIIISTAIGIVSYYMIEKPAMKLKDFFITK